MELIPRRHAPSTALCLSMVRSCSQCSLSAQYRGWCNGAPTQPSRLGTAVNLGISTTNNRRVSRPPDLLSSSIQDTNVAWFCWHGQCWEGRNKRGLEVQQQFRGNEGTQRRAESHFSGFCKGKSCFNLLSPSRGHQELEETTKSVSPYVNPP